MRNIFPWTQVSTSSSALPREGSLLDFDADALSGPSSAGLSVRGDRDTMTDRLLQKRRRRLAFLEMGRRSRLVLFNHAANAETSVTPESH